MLDDSKNTLEAKPVFSISVEQLIRKNIAANRLIQECRSLPMSEKAQLHLVGLSIALLDLTELVFDSMQHVSSAIIDKTSHHYFVQIVEAITVFHSAVTLPIKETLPPTVSLFGPWKANDIFNMIPAK